MLALKSHCLPLAFGFNLLMTAARYSFTFSPILSSTALRFQRVLWGIKRHQGSAAAKWLPITNHITLIILRSLDLALPDPCMFWAACTPAYFDFLHLSELTVPILASFQTFHHLQVDDIAVDPNSLPICMRENEGLQGPVSCRLLHLYWAGRAPLCAVQAMMKYLAIGGIAPGPLFLFQDGQALSRSLLTSQLRQILVTAAIPSNLYSHSFRIGAATVAARNGIPTT